MPTTFTTNPIALKTLLDGLRDGSIQLPDFQRGWVWDDERIRAVLASVSRAFPIGAVMMLQTGGDTHFKTRPVQGVDEKDVKPPTQLILDGQQRLTSLFQAMLLGQVVETVNPRNQPIKVWFYVDMIKAMNGDEDRESAFVTVPEKRVRSDLQGNSVFDISTPEKEYANLMFPCSALLDSSAWRRGFNKFWQQDSEKADLFDRFEERIIEQFKQYQLPVITLTRDVTKEAVCHVFEKVNTGGVTLTAFELLTATYAAESFQLRRDWLGPSGKDDTGTYIGVLPRLREHPVLRGTHDTDFLQAVVLLDTYRARKAATMRGAPPNEVPAVSCTRKTVLDLQLARYLGVRDAVVEGFVRASKFLVEQNIFSHRDLPYQTQLVPLSVILMELGSGWENHAVKEKVRRWFWWGVLGELYGGAIETRFARDVPEVLDWVEGKGEPSTVHDTSFNPGRLLSLRTRGSAAYKGLYALLMGDHAYEWLTGTTLTVNTYAAERIDIHHIFPKTWCKDKKIDDRRMDCIVNKTALSARTNRKIGGRSPSRYLQTIMRDGGPPQARLFDYLRSHIIEPEHLAADDFEAFFAARKAALLKLIGAATGHQLEVEFAEPDVVDDEWEEADAEDETAEAA
jgi:hypothetical protein